MALIIRVLFPEISNDADTILRGTRNLSFFNVHKMYHIFVLP